MKSTTFLRFLFSFILIGLFGCEIEQINPSDKESVEPVTELQAKDPEFNYISQKDIPDIMEEIKGRILDGEIKQTSGKLSYNNVDIDLDEIMEVVAESNETNFTFALDVKNGPKHHIYNLVIGKDANGNAKEPYVIGYEMKPKDMKAFFKNGLDYSKFKARYHYYTFDSFFADSKLNRVGKNGDCGDGTIGSTGGDPISQTTSGGTFTHTYQGSTVNNVFNTGTPQLPYQYTVTIVDSNGTASTSTTEAETQVQTITAGTQTGTTTITAPGLPNSAYTTYSYTVTVAPDSGLGSGGGASYTCVHTIMIIGSIKIEAKVCDDGNAQKRYTGRSGKSDDCPNTEGAVAINTAAKPVQKLFYALDESLSPLEIEFFGDNTEKAKSINAFIIAEAFAQIAKDYGKKAVDDMLKGHPIVSFSPYIKYPKGSNYENQYPKLTEYLKNQLPKVADISKITDALHEFTQLPLDKIKNDLKWGDNGPILEIVQLDDYPGCSTCKDNTAGYFDEEQPDRIFLDIDYVNQIETGNVVETDDDAFIFFLGTTILHEYVHYGENSNPDFFYWGEEGVKFEIKVYGDNVTPHNARLILNRN